MTISKNPDFGHFILLDGKNSVFSFNKYKKIFSPFLAAGFCPKSFVFAQKIMVCPSQGGAAPQPPGSYAYVLGRSCEIW